MTSCSSRNCITHSKRTTCTFRKINYCCCTSGYTNNSLSSNCTKTDFFITTRYTNIDVTSGSSWISTNSNMTTSTFCNNSESISLLIKCFDAVADPFVVDITCPVPTALIECILFSLNYNVPVN